jgi:hypothetical protein
LFQENKVDAIAGNGLNARNPRSRAVAQLVKLPRLGTKYVAQVVRGVAVHNRGGSSEFVNKESAAHARILAHF